MALLIDPPTPKLSPGTPRSFVWPVNRRLTCPPVVGPPPNTFSEVIEHRRSTRALEPISFRELVNVLSFSTRPRFRRANDPASETLRPTPAAGALHSTNTIIVDWRSSIRIYRYDPDTHLLESLKVVSREHADRLTFECGQILPSAGCTAVALVTDLQRIGAKYENPESLAWRDAGALLQTLSLCANAYRLGTCILGLTGHDLLRAIALPADEFLAVGVMMVGRQRQP